MIGRLFLTTICTTPLACGAIVLKIPPEPLFVIRDGEPPLMIDIDGNGSVDVQFTGAGFLGSSVRTERANRVVVQPATPPNLGGLPFPLADNTMIGPSSLPPGVALISTDVRDGFSAPDETGNFADLVLCLNTGCSGLFYTPFETRRSFLGVEFEADGGIHYGYFDITMNPRSTGGIINGWAYESEPGVAITTTFVPEPGSSAMLALSGLLIVRRRRET